MKIIFSILTLLTISLSCNSTKESAAESKEPVVASKPNTEAMTKKSDVVGEHYSTSEVTYKATSRGFFEFVQISGEKVSISNDRNLQEIEKYTIDEKTSKELSRLIQDVDTQNLRKLKAPTDKRLYDGAAHATLTIRTGDMAMMSPTFDHGFPPKEIEALVNKVLSIKESVLKQ